MSTQLGLSRYAHQIKDAYCKVKDSHDNVNWVIYSYDKDNELKPFETGDGGLEELIDEFNSSKIQYAFARVIEPISGLPKIVMICWCGEGVPVQRKGLFHSHVNDFQRFFTGYHVAINARNEEDVTVASIMKKVKDSSGAKYSIHQQEASQDDLRPAPRPMANVQAAKPAPYASSYLSKPASTSSSLPSKNAVPVAAPAPPPAPRPTPPAPAPAPPPPTRPIVKEDKPEPVFDGLTEGDRKRIAERERRMKEDAELREREARAQSEREARENNVDELLEGDRKRIAERERRMKEDTELREREARAQADRKARENAQFSARQKSSLTSIPAAVPLPSRPLRSEPPPPQPQFQGITATAMYAYTAEESNEISFEEGEVITDIEEIDEDWWQGTNARGEIGLFASNYVSKNESLDISTRVVPEPSLPAPRAIPEPAPPAPRAVPEPAVPAAGPPPSLPPRPTAPASVCAIAIYDYEASEENEISFSAGDTIENIFFVSEDWWQGEINGRQGVFPGNYVELHG